MIFLLKALCFFSLSCRLSHSFFRLSSSNMFRRTLQTATRSFVNRPVQQGRAIHRVREFSMYRGAFNAESNSRNVAGFALVTAAGLATMSLAAQAAHAEAVTDSEDKFKHTKLYPPIEAHYKGMLRVSDIHSIAYSEYGNPNGNVPRSSLIYLSLISHNHIGFYCRQTCDFRSWRSWWWNWSFHGPLFRP